MTIKQGITRSAAAVLLAAMFFAVFSFAAAENDPGMPTVLRFKPNVYEVTVGNVCRPAVYLTVEDPDAFDSFFGRVDFSLLYENGAAEITGEYSGDAQTGYYTGGVKGLHPGIEVVNARVPGRSGEPQDGCTIIVHSAEPVCVPDGVTVIDKETFYGIAADEIILGDGVTRIESGAFANCTGLGLITIPKSVTYIAEDAFDGCGQVCFVCIAESIAHNYAKEQGILSHAVQPVLSD